MTTQEDALSYLSALSPGMLPKDVFYALARLIVTPIVFLVPLRTKDVRVEVKLLPRDVDDPYWAGMLHVPGTVLLSTDTKGSLTSALTRILENELHYLADNATPHFVSTHFGQVKRGSEIKLIHWIELDESSNEHWYPVKDLPPRLIDTEITPLQIAVDSYCSVKGI